MGRTFLSDNSESPARQVRTPRDREGSEDAHALVGEALARGRGFVLMTASVKGRDVGFLSYAQARVFGMTMFGDDIGR